MAQRICSIDGCGRPHWSRGWCDSHYHKWYELHGRKETERARDERTARHQQELATGLRQCRKCNQLKPFSEYGVNNRHAGGMQRSCKPCMRVAWVEREARKDKEVVQRARLKNRMLTRYGMTLEQRDAMETAQGGRCAACGCEPRRLVVDHCHDSGKVRALLCDFCNKALGLVRDNPETLRQLIEYLGRHAS